jgi:membrane-associated protease RseP (regulator of RpoE activity)
MGRTYREKPFWAKSVVVLAGVVSHFVVAFLIYFLVFAGVGVESGELTNRVAAVSASLDEAGERPSPAAIAGLEVGDEIVALDGIPTPEWDLLVDEIASRPGQDVTIDVLRDGEAVRLTTTLAMREDGQGGMNGYLGVSPTGVVERSGPIAAVGDASGAVVEATVRDNPDWNLIAETAALAVPTTLIGGDPEHGGIVPVTIGEWFAAENPIMDYEMLAGSGHSAHREPASYEAFLEAVLRAVEVPA